MTDAYFAIIILFVSGFFTSMIVVDFFREQKAPGHVYVNFLLWGVQLSFLSMLISEVSR